MALADRFEVDTGYFLGNSFTFEIEDIRDNISNILKGRVPGVYCFYNKEGIPLYLGKTIDLKSRIKQHICGHSTPTKELAPSLHYIKFLPIDAKSHGLYLIEKVLIMNIKPLFNGSSQGTDKNYGYTNLRAWFNNKVQEYGIFPEKVVSEQIDKFTSRVCDDYLKLDLKDINHSSDAPLIDTTLITYVDVVEDEEDEVSNGRGVDIQAIREAMKLLIGNCSPSDKLDAVLDGLLELQVN